ncbi:HNH endonuclease [Pseudomonas chlororaphis]
MDRHIYNFIGANRRIITCGTALDLQGSIEDYFKRFGKGLLRSCVGEKLKEIFDYSSFSQKSNKPWTAYHLCSQAQYQTCSYCQLVATGTCLPDEETKGYRPPIDHYYGKADYPFLALTLSNFIPCCEKCNGSQMKGVIDFSAIPHLNPLVDVESIAFALTLVNGDHSSIAEAVTLNMPKNNYHLKLYIKTNQQKAQASMETFQLQSRYQHYSGPAYHLAKVMRGVSARLSMQQESLDFDTSIEDYLEFPPQDYKTVPYGKVRVCIAEQFGALPV